MIIECLLFWFVGWVGFELCRVRYLATHLALVLSWLLGLVVVLLLLGLDLLAVFIASVYSSVFVAVSLLALQFGPFWAAAINTAPGVGSTRGYLPGCLGVLAVILGLVVGCEPTVAWEGALLWQDLAIGLTLPLQSTLLHSFFFHSFVVETLGLNLYLFLGLVGVVFLLLTRTVGVGGATGTGMLLPTRQRLVARLRRQVRRTHASGLRHRR